MTHQLHADNVITIALQQKQHTQKCMRQTEILRRGFVCSYRCSTMHVHDPFFIIHLLFLRSISLAHLVAAGQYLLNLLVILNNGYSTL